MDRSDGTRDPIRTRWLPSVVVVKETYRLPRSPGSIKHIPNVPLWVKRVFRTSWEWSPATLVDMAAERAPFIEQSYLTQISVPRYQPTTRVRPVQTSSYTCVSADCCELPARTATSGMGTAPEDCVTFHRAPSHSHITIPQFVPHAVSLAGLRISHVGMASYSPDGTCSRKTPRL